MGSSTPEAYYSFVDSEELELSVVKKGPVRRKYVLEVKPNVSLDPELSKAVIFAQNQLLGEIEQNGYNVLLSERWVAPIIFFFFFAPFVSERVE